MVGVANVAAGVGGRPVPEAADVGAEATGVRAKAAGLLEVRGMEIGAAGFSKTADAAFETAGAPTPGADVEAEAGRVTTTGEEKERQGKNCN